MLELARLLLDFVFVLYFKSLGEKSLSKTVTADYISGPLLTGRSEVHNELSVLL